MITRDDFDATCRALAAVHVDPASTPPSELVAWLQNCCGFRQADAIEMAGLLRRAVR